MKFKFDNIIKKNNILRWCVEKGNVALIEVTKMDGKIYREIGFKFAKN
jgi:hypothetical protein